MQVLCSLVSIYFDSLQLGLQKKKKNLSETLANWSRDMLNFHFSEKGLGVVSAQEFVYDFWRKMFLML